MKKKYIIFIVFFLLFILGFSIYKGFSYSKNEKISFIHKANNKKSEIENTQTYIPKMNFYGDVLSLKTKKRNL